jgi:hypothetical protein
LSWTNKMASSRWKRFAFFERHTLNLTTDVLEDLIPTDSEVSKTRRSLRSLEAVDAGDDTVALVTTTAALPSTSKPRLHEAKQQADDDDATSAMWSSLLACSEPSIPSDDSKSNVRFASQGQQPTQNHRESIDSSSMDGLVLTFVTSRYTELIHCLDVTVRCNPPPSSVDMDDMDGWRGYFAPFAKPLREQQQQQQNPAQRADVDHHMTAVDVVSLDVMAMAACRGVSGHKPVLLACIAKTKVVVWEDPHLHLSCRRPLTSPKVPPDAKLYSLQTPWNSNDGECQAVDIIAQLLLAVGTSTGYVIVFAYDPTRRVLRTYLRIPPPPAGGETEAVAVKLSSDADKACVFVAYRRKAAEATSASAGICCYEMPLPTLSVGAITAPLARHDLDGRSVGGASLLDSFYTSTGLQLTVVSCPWKSFSRNTKMAGVSTPCVTSFLGSPRRSLFLFKNRTDRCSSD